MRIATHCKSAKYIVSINSKDSNWDSISQGLKLYVKYVVRFESDYDLNVLDSKKGAKISVNILGFYVEGKCSIELIAMPIFRVKQFT